MHELVNSSISMTEVSDAWLLLLVTSSRLVSFGTKDVLPANTFNICMFCGLRMGLPVYAVGSQQQQILCIFVLLSFAVPRGQLSCACLWHLILGWHSCARDCCKQCLTLEKHVYCSARRATVMCMPLALKVLTGIHMPEFAAKGRLSGT